MFVGRRNEIELVEGTLERVARTAQASVLLVGGEAGIGKSRLIHEAINRARNVGWLVIEGFCSDLENSPQAFPILHEVVGQLKAFASARATGGREALSAVDPTELTRLAQASELPHFMARILADFSFDVPVVLVVEDCHWADQSTRNLLAGLSRALMGRVLLIISYRDEEVVSGHPLLPVLASLHRRTDCEELALGPMSRTEFEHLIIALGSEDRQEVATSLHERASGNPLFLEELLAGSPASWSPGVRHALIRRLFDLGPAALEIAELACLDTGCDFAVLESAFPSSESEFLDAFDSLIEHHVLEDRDGVRFRHALIQETLAETIPPMRKRTLHRALAEARMRHSPDAPEVIAHHWRHAGRREEAFAWAVVAGQTALRRGAPPEGAGWLESALDDWGRIANPESLAGRSYFDLVRLAELALMRSRQFDRAAALLIRALEVPDRMAPGEASMAWFFLSLHLGLAGDGRNQPFSSREALERSRLSLSESTPDLVRVIALSSYAVRMLLCYADEGAAREAWSEAERILDRLHGETPPIVLAARASVLAYRGDPDSEAAIAACEASDVVAVRRAGPESWLRPMLGAHEENIRACSAGIEQALRERDAASSGVMLFSSMALSLTSLGRWQEALELWRTMVREVSETVLVDDFGAVLRGWGPLFVRTANEELLRPYLERSIDRRPDGVAHYLPAQALVEIEIARANGEWRTVTATAERLLASVNGRVLFAEAAQAVSSAAGALADAAFSLRVDRDAAADTAGRWVRKLETVMEHGSAGTPHHDAPKYLAQAQAEYLRILGQDTSDVWEGLVNAWHSTGRPFNEAYTRFRRAFHLLTGQAGNPVRTRALARQELSQASEIAEGLGAVLLSHEVRSLATTAGLPLRGSAARSPSLLKSSSSVPLTPREYQVARLLSEGLTNGQIGLRLGMSPKTVSVHVGNIAAKVGAENRVQTAMLVRSRGLLASST